MISPTRKAAVVQRQCACGRPSGPGGLCAECAANRSTLQRSLTGRGAVPKGLAQAHGIAHRAGQPLNDGLRSVMEQRLGKASQSVSIQPIASGSAVIDEPDSADERTASSIARHREQLDGSGPRFDFRHVRVHADHVADAAARSIDANAFTLGSNIAFRTGRFDPGNREGRDLLAHELTHIIQQTGGGLRLQRQAAGDQRVRYEERVDAYSHPTGDPMSVWSGSMTRRELLEEYKKTKAKDKTPASEGWQEVTSREGKANLEFDPKACSVRLPLRINFKNPSWPPKTHWDPCSQGNPAPEKGLDASTFTSMRAIFITQLNSGLNGWFTAKIDGCAGAPCAGKKIPIVVDVHDGGAAEERDQTVYLINAKGRSCADHNGAYIYAPGGEAETRMWVHEAGHFLLGYGDEYKEKGYPSARVTSDYSAMGEAEKTRYATFHARHFKFVPVFLDTILREMGQTGCQTSLEEISHPLPTSFNFMFGEGLYASNIGSALYLSGGIEFGRTDTQRRAVERIVGLQGKYFLGAGKENQSAFLLGVRLGVERRWGGSEHGFTLGGFGEGGFGAYGIGSKEGWRPGAYAEAGGYLQYKAPLDSGIPNIRLEGAAGTRIGATGQIGDAPVDAPQSMDQWVRLGFNAAWAF
jgi:hypothetical protein